MFEELAFQVTEIGEISLRRRKLLQLGGIDVFEVKLGDEHLMSSLFYHAEEQLADLALAQVDGAEIDVIVGGLGSIR
ncbi:MAG: spermidine synthase, partial [Bdellovibrionota bacterium]